MAPISTKAFMGSILASTTHNPRSLPLPPSTTPLLTPPSPSTASITPALAFRRVSRVFFASLTKRDDDDGTTTNPALQRRLESIFPAIIGFFILCSIWSCTREYFRKGGTWKGYLKSWGKAVFFFLLLTVLLPITILGCIINCRRDKRKKQQQRPAGQARPLQPANNPYNSHEPPPPNRPQMPLDPVVLLPDQPDQEDPDAVENVATTMPQPPPPVQQKPESTAEATANMLDSKGSKTSP
ncbi:hypothetical protein SEUCBS139899_004497 [Sporothrix eucalyptigena]|uniref:Uncharacterized protein n=1 Tax=Sporothrix eucalyptigena TaxID=1812306 RepID=A0ABP0BG27_9PEZI